MARRSRNAPRSVSVSHRTPTTPIAEPSDDEMAGSSPPGVQSPAGDKDEEMIEDLVEEEEEDEPGTPDDVSETLAQAMASRRQSQASRGRRAGRPPRNRARNRDAVEGSETRDPESDAGTPRKRGGWRGRGFGGGRWGKLKGGASHASQAPLDKDGNAATVENDEVVLPKDPEGEAKVDELGNLLDGREYRVRVFTIAGKGGRLYMLSTEPARCIGFRDSYLFFQKHRQLYKIILSEDAKRDLIERNVIPHSYKGRAIGVVTARSVFREFGAQIIIGGKKIIDDYAVSEARANGDVEGEIAVPDDKLPGSGEEYDRNRYVAWHGASSVYHSGAPSIPVPNGKIAEGKKRKVVVTGVNWMFEHAREASRFNSALVASRRENLDGVYDPHTNVMQYPRIMQPSHARWEHVSDNPVDGQVLYIPGNHADLIYDMPANATPDSPGSSAQSIFPDVAPLYTRNFMITDTNYISPPISGLGVPGPDGEDHDIGSQGLPHVPDSVLAKLPLDCREALIEARAEEAKWKSTWGAEADGNARARLHISYNT